MKPENAPLLHLVELARTAAEALRRRADELAVLRDHVWERQKLLDALATHTNYALKTDHIERAALLALELERLLFPEREVGYDTLGDAAAAAAERAELRELDVLAAELEIARLEVKRAEDTWIDKYRALQERYGYDTAHASASMRAGEPVDEIALRRDRGLR